MLKKMTRRASLTAIACVGIAPGAATGARRSGAESGLFVHAHLFNIPHGTESISLTGTRRAGDEGAGQRFVADPKVDAAYVAANPETAFVERGGRGFRRAFDAARLKRELSGVGEGGGSAMVGHRRSPAASITSTHGKLRFTVIMGEDYGSNGKFNSAELELAAKEAQRIVIPESVTVTTIAETVKLAPHTTIAGRGPEQSILNVTAPLGFLYESPKGFDQYQSPTFEHLRLTCAKSGIRLNSSAGGFTDRPDTQMSLMNPRLYDVDIRGPGPEAGGSIGVEWNKCVRGIVDQSNIQGFSTGFLSLGSDLCEIRGRSRIWNCGTLAQIVKIAEDGYNYGSGFRFDGCDLLGPTVNFIISNDNDLKILDCYFESGAEIHGYVLDLSGTNAQSIRNNRFEVPARYCQRFLRQNGELSLFVFENNNTDGEAWGSIEWNGGGGARYWKSVLRRQRLMFSGNITDMAEVPFRTVDPEPPADYRQPWIFTPHTTGLMPLNYGTTVRVRGGAFILPPRRAHGSLCIFKSERQSAAGNIMIHVLARAIKRGQLLSVTRYRGSEYDDSATVPLATSYAWHSVLAGESGTDLRIGVHNDDVATGDDVLVRQIVVERSGQ